MTTATEIPEEGTTIEPEPYPAWAEEDEQRRAFVLDCIGTAASEMDTQTLCHMVVDLAEMLRTGAPPVKMRKLRPVP